MPQFPLPKKPDLSPAHLSLLWLDSARPRPHADSAWVQDLGLDTLLRAFEVGPRYSTFIRETLATLQSDSALIAWRQAVLADFLANPSLVEAINALLPRLADLNMGHAQLGRHKRSALFETVDRLAELDLYLDVVQNLYAALRSAHPESEALRNLSERLQNIIDDKTFQALLAEMPELRRPLQNVRSLTVGINLDSQLQPRSTILLAVNEQPFMENRSFLSRLLGAARTDSDESGIAPLHMTPSDPDQRPLSVLFQDLEQLITKAAQPVARSLSRYVRLSSAPLTGLENELAFYCAAVGLIRRLEARGITFCRPEIAPMEDGTTEIVGLINLNLLARNPTSPVVSNDLRFDAEGRIAILTGPNSGGKTTYVQAVGLAQVLFQAGLFIAAQKARLSPADAIFTHFPALEAQQGRLSEEAARLRRIFLSITRYSLVLMNESLSSTTAHEALYLAQDLMGALRVIGVRAIFATHLVELANRIDEIEASIPGEGKLYSLVAGVEFADGTATEGVRAVPTFRIVRGLPEGKGYAHEIARRNGISLEQILEARRETKTP